MNEKLRELENVQPDEVVMFSGSTIMTTEIFAKFYVPLIKKVIEKQGKVRVSCAKGCDLYVQIYCQHLRYFKVEVYIPSEQQDEAIFISDNFQKTIVNGGFKTRDRAMQVNCKYFVGFFSQYAGAASGTAANAISIAAKNGAFGDACRNLDGYTVVTLLRSLSFPFNNELAQQVWSSESKTCAPAVEQEIGNLLIHLF